MEVKNVSEESSGHVCDLCGTVSPSVFCGQCNKRYFCGSCDNMYHTHPKRQMHNRQPLIGTEADSPVRPPKKRSHLQTSSDITSSKDSITERENLDTSGIPTPPPKRKPHVHTSAEPAAISTSLSSLHETDIPPTAPPKRRSRVQTPIEILVTDESLTSPPEKLSDIANIPIPPPKRKSGRLSAEVKTFSSESISEVTKGKDESDIFKIPPVPPPRRSHSQTSVDKGSTESLERKVVPIDSVSAPLVPKRRLRTPQSETSLPALDDDDEVLFSSEGRTVPIPPKRHSQMRTPDSVISLPNMPSQTEAMFSGDSSTLPIAPKRRSHLKTPDSVTSLPAFSDQKEAIFYRPNIPTPPPRKSIRTCSSVTSLPNFATEYTTAPTPPPKRSHLITADSLPDKERTSSTHSPTPPPRRKKRELESSNLSLQSVTEHKRECLQSRARDDDIKDEFKDSKESILRERGILQSYENIVPPPRRSKPHSTSDLVLSKIPLEEKGATLPRSADYSQVVKRPISAALALHREDLQDWGKVTSAPDVRNIDIWDKAKYSKTVFQGENIPYEAYIGKQTDQSVSEDIRESKEAELQSSLLTEIQPSEAISSQVHPHYPYSQPVFASIPPLASVYSTSCPQCYVNSWSNLTPATDWPTGKDESIVYQQSHIHGMKRSHSAIHDPSSAQTGYHPAGSGLYPYGTVIPHFCPHGHFSSRSYATDSSSQSSTCQRRPRKKRSSSRKKKSESEDRQKQSESGSESGEVDIHSFTSEELKVTSDIKQSTEDIQTKPEDTWVCQHCTYINPPGSNICEICCRTSLCEETSSTEQKIGMVEKTTVKSISREDKSLQTQNQKLESEEHPVESVISTDKYPIEKTSIKMDAAEQTSEILSETTNITSKMEKAKLSKTSSQSGDQKDSSCQTSHESLGEFSSHENLEFGTHPPRAVMSDVSPQTSPLLGRKGLRRPTPPPLGFSPIFGKSAQSGQSMFRTSVHSDLTVAGRSLLPHEPVHDSSGYGTTDSLYHSWSHPSLLSDNIGRGHDRSFSPRPLSPRIGESSKGESGLSASDGVQVGYAAQKPKSQWESDPGQLSRITEHFEQSRLIGESHSEELKNLIREAEQHGFSIEDVQVALERCGRDDPLVWLEENWQGMIENVAALATDYNDDKCKMEIGIVSTNEARDALRMHRGDMRVAILECVNSRRSKIQELLARGNFNEDDIAEALTANQGNIELTYADLVKSTLQPFLYQPWDTKQSTQEVQSSIEPTIPSVTDDEKRKSPGLISKLHSRMKSIDRREKETIEHDKEILKISEGNDITEFKDIQEPSHLEEISISENSIKEKIPIIESDIFLIQHEERKQEDTSKSILENEEKEKVTSESKEIEDITSETKFAEIDEPYSIEKVKVISESKEIEDISSETKFAEIDEPYSIEKEKVISGSKEIEDITSETKFTEIDEPYSIEKEKVISGSKEIEDITSETKFAEIDEPYSIEINKIKTAILHSERPLKPAKTTEDIISTSVLTTALQSSQSLSSVARPLTSPGMTVKKTSILQTSKSLSFEGNENKKLILHTSRPLTPVIRSSKYEDDFSRAISSELLAEEMGDLFTSEDITVPDKIEETLITDEAKEELQEEVIKETLVKEKSPPSLEKIEKNHTSNSDEDFVDAPGVAQVEDIVEYGSVKYGDYGFASPAAQMYASLIQSTEVSSPKKKKQKDSTLQKGEKAGKSKCLSSVPTIPPLKWVSPGRTILSEDKWSVKSNLTHTHSLIEEKKINSQISDQNIFKEQSVTATTFHNGRLFSEKSDQFDSNGNKIISSDNESLTSDAYTDAFEEPTSPRSFKSFSDSESLASDAYVDAVELSSPPPSYHECKSDTESLLSETYTDAAEEPSSPSEFKTPPMTDVELDSDKHEKLETTLSSELKLKEISETNDTQHELQLTEKSATKYEEELTLSENVESWAVANLYESLMSDIIVEKKTTKPKTPKKNIKVITEKKDTALVEGKMFQREDNIIQKQNVPREDILSQKLTDEQSKIKNEKETEKSIQRKPKTLTEETLKQKEMETISYEYKSEMPTLEESKIEQKNIAKVSEIIPKLSETVSEKSNIISSSKILDISKISLQKSSEEIPLKTQEEKILSEEFISHKENLKEKLLEQEIIQDIQIQKLPFESTNLKEEKKTIFEDQERVTKHLIMDENIPSIPIAENIGKEESFTENISDVMESQLQKDYDIPIQQIHSLETNGKKIKEEKLYFPESQLETTEIGIVEPQLEQKSPPMYPETGMEEISLSGDKYFYELQEHSPEMYNRISENLEPYESENLSEEELHFYDDYEYFVTEEREQDLKYVKEELASEFTDTFADVESSLKEITEVLEHEEEMLTTETFEKEQIEDQLKEEILLPSKDEIKRFPFVTIASEEKLILEDEDITQSIEKKSLSKEEYVEEINKRYDDEILQEKDDDLYKNVKLEKSKRKTEDEEKLSNIKHTKLIEVPQLKFASVCEEVSSNIGTQDTVCKEIISEDSEIIVSKDKKLKIELSKDQISTKYQDDSKVILDKEKPYDLIGITESSKTKTSDIEIYDGKKIIGEKKSEELENIEFKIKQEEYQEIKYAELEETKNIYEKEISKEQIAKSCEIEASISEEYIVEKTDIYENKHIILEDTKDLEIKVAELQKIEYPEAEETIDVKKEKAEQQITESPEAIISSSEHEIELKVPIYENKQTEIKSKAPEMKAERIYETETYEKSKEIKNIDEKEKLIEYSEGSTETEILVAEEYIEEKALKYEKQYIKLENIKELGMKAVELQEIELSELEETKDIPEQEKSKEYIAESSEAETSASEEYTEFKVPSYEKKQINLQNVKSLGMKAVELQEIECIDLEETKDILEKEKSIECIAESSEAKTFASEEYAEFKVPSYEKKQINLQNVKSLGMKAVELQEIECIDLEETKDIPEKEKSKECIAESSEAETSASEEYAEVKVPTYEKKKVNLKNIKSLGMKAVELQEIECIDLEETKDIPEKEKSKECIAESSEAETSASEEYAEVKVSTYEKKKVNLKNIKSLGMKAVELQEIECIDLEETKDIPEKEKSKECIAESSEAETSASEEYAEVKVPTYEKKKVNLKNIKSLGMKAVELQEIECIDLEETKDIPEKEKSKECVAESSEAETSASEEYAEVKVPTYEKKKANLKNIKALGMKAAQIHESEKFEWEEIKDIPEIEKPKKYMAESSETETSASEEYTEIKIFTYKQEQAKMEDIKASKMNAIQIQEPEKYTAENLETEISASKAYIEEKPIIDQEEHVKFQDDEMLEFKITKTEETEYLDQKDNEQEHRAETFKTEITTDKEHLEEKVNLLKSKISSAVEIISDKQGSKEAEIPKPILEAKIDIEEELKLKDTSETENNKLQEFKMPVDIPKPPRRKSKTEKRRTSKGELIWESSESLAISETSGETTSIAESEESFNFFEYMKSFSSEKIDSKDKFENETSPMPVPPRRKSKTLERKPRKVENDDFTRQSKSTEALPTEETEFNYFQYLKTKSEESQNKVPIRPRRKSKTDKNLTSSEISLEEDKIFEIKGLVPQKEPKSQDKITIETTQTAQIKQDISIATENVSSETKLDKNIQDIESMEIEEMKEIVIEDFNKFEKEKANIEKSQTSQKDIKYKLKESRFESLEIETEKSAEKDEIKIQEESVFKKDEFVKIERDEQMDFEIIKEPSTTTLKNQNILPLSLNTEENEEDTLRKEEKTIELQTDSQMNITDQIYDAKNEQYEIKEKSEVEDIPIVPKRKKVDVNKDIKTDLIEEKISTPLIEKEIISKDLKDSLSDKHITSLNKLHESEEEEKSQYKKFEYTDEIKEGIEITSHLQKEVEAEEAIPLRPKRKERELKDSQSIKIIDKYNEKNEVKLKEKQEKTNETKYDQFKLENGETSDEIILEQREDQIDIKQKIEQTDKTTLKVQKIEEEIIFHDQKEREKENQDKSSQKLQELLPKQAEEQKEIKLKEKEVIPKPVEETKEKIKEKSPPKPKEEETKQKIKEKSPPKPKEEEKKDIKLKEKEVITKTVEETKEKIKEKTSPKPKEEEKKEKEMVAKPVEEPKQKIKEKSPPKPKEEEKKEKEMVAKPVEETKEKIKEKSPPKTKEEEKKEKEMIAKPVEETKEKIKEKSPPKPKEEEKKEKEMDAKIVEESKEKSPPKLKEEEKKEIKLKEKEVIIKQVEETKEKSPPKQKEEEKKEKEMVAKPVEETKEKIKEKTPPKPKEEEKKEIKLKEKEVTPKPAEEKIKEKTPPKPKEEEKKEIKLKEKDVTPKPAEEKIKEKTPPKPKEEEKKEKEMVAKPVEEPKQKIKEKSPPKPKEEEKKEKEMVAKPVEETKEKIKEKSLPKPKEKEKKEKEMDAKTVEETKEKSPPKLKEEEKKEIKLKEKEVITKQVEETKEKSPSKQKEEEKKEKEMVAKPVEETKEKIKEKSPPKPKEEEKKEKEMDAKTVEEIKEKTPPKPKEEEKKEIKLKEKEVITKPVEETKEKIKEKSPPKPKEEEKKEKEMVAKPVEETKQKIKEKSPPKPKEEEKKEKEIVAKSVEETKGKIKEKSLPKPKEKEKKEKEMDAKTVEETKEKSPPKLKEEEKKEIKLKEKEVITKQVEETKEKSPSKQKEEEKKEKEMVAKPVEETKEKIKEKSPPKPKEEEKKEIKLKEKEAAPKLAEEKIKEKTPPKPKEEEKKEKEMDAKTVEEIKEKTPPKPKEEEKKEIKLKEKEVITKPVEETKEKIKEKSPPKPKEEEKKEKEMVAKPVEETKQKIKEKSPPKPKEEEKKEKEIVAKSVEETKEKIKEKTPPKPKEEEKKDIKLKEKEEITKPVEETKEKIKEKTPPKPKEEEKKEIKLKKKDVTPKPAEEKIKEKTPPKPKEEEKKETEMVAKPVEETKEKSPPKPKEEEKKEIKLKEKEVAPKPVEETKLKMKEKSPPKPKEEEKKEKEMIAKRVEETKEKIKEKSPPKPKEEEKKEIKLKEKEAAPKLAEETKEKLKEKSPPKPKEEEKKEIKLKEKEAAPKLAEETKEKLKEKSPPKSKEEEKKEIKLKEKEAATKPVEETKQKIKEKSPPKSKEEEKKEKQMVAKPIEETKEKIKEKSPPKPKEEEKKEIKLKEKEAATKPVEETKQKIKEKSPPNLKEEEKKEIKLKEKEAAPKPVEETKEKIKEKSPPKPKEEEKKEIKLKKKDVTPKPAEEKIKEKTPPKPKEEEKKETEMVAKPVEETKEKSPPKPKEEEKKEIKLKEKEVAPKPVEETKLKMKEKSPPKPKEEEKKEKEMIAKRVEETKEKIKEKSPPKPKEEEKKEIKLKEKEAAPKLAEETKEKLKEKSPPKPKEEEKKEIKLKEKEAAPKLAEETKEKLKEKSSPKPKEEEKKEIKLKEKEAATKPVEETKQKIKEKSPPKPKEEEKKEKEMVAKPVEETKEKIKEKSPPKPKEEEKKEIKLKEKEAATKPVEETKQKIKEKSLPKPKEEEKMEKEIVAKPVEETKEKIKEKSPPKPKEEEKKEIKLKETEVIPKPAEEKIKEKSPPKPKEKEKKEKEMVAKTVEETKEKIKEKSPPKPKEEEKKEKSPTKLKEKEKISSKSKEMKDGKEIKKIIKSKEEIESIQYEEKFHENGEISNKELIKDQKVVKKKRKSSLKLKLNEKEEITDEKLVTSSKRKDSLSLDETISVSERNKIERTIGIESPKHSIRIAREIPSIEKDLNLKSCDKISPSISLKSLSSCRDERFSSQSSIEYISSRSPSKTRESFHEEIVPYGLPPRPKPRKKLRESVTEIAYVQPTLIQHRRSQPEYSVNLEESSNFALEQRLFTKSNQGEMKKKVVSSISSGRPTFYYEPKYTRSLDRSLSVRKSYDSPSMIEPYISPTRREIKSINVPSITTDYKKQTEVYSKPSISYKTPSLEDISSYTSRSYSPSKTLINRQKNLDYVNISLSERSSSYNRELSRSVSLRNLAKTEPRPSSPITTKKQTTQTEDYLSIAERRAEIRRRRKQQAQMTLWNSLQDISLASDDTTFTRLKRQEPCFTRSTSVRDITVEDERYISAFRRLKDIIIEPPAPPPRLLKEMRKEREIKIQYRSLREICTENIPVPPPRAIRQVNYKYIPQKYSLRDTSEREISPYNVVRTSILEDSIRTSREILRQSSEAKKIYKIISSTGQNREQESFKEIPKKQRNFQHRSYFIEDINKRGALYLPVFQPTTKYKDNKTSSSVLNRTDIMLRTHGRSEESRTKYSQTQKFRSFSPISKTYTSFNERDRSISPINRFKNIDKISEEKMIEISRSSPDFSIETVTRRYVSPIKISKQSISSTSKLKEIYDSDNLSNIKFNKVSQSSPDIRVETTIRSRYISPVKRRENRSISPFTRLKEICSSDDVSNKNFREISQYPSYFSAEATVRNRFNSPIKTERCRRSISPMTKLKKICSSENIADEKEISRSSPDFASETSDRYISPIKSRRARQSISPMQRMRHIYGSDEKTDKTSRSSSPIPLSSERIIPFRPILTETILTSRQSRTRTRSRPASSNEKKISKVEREDKEQMDKATMISKLIEMEFNKEESGQAAQHCDTIYQAVKFLQQQCDLCENYFPANQMITMLYCSHKSCRECLRAYFLVEIQDRNVDNWLCPLCDKPDLSDENATQDYFNHLDIMLKNLVDTRIYELFQQKLRDNILMKNPDFHWCSQCSSGLIASPGIVKLECHDCGAVTCTRCHWLWDNEHEARSCAEFQALKTTKSSDDEEGLEFKLEMQGTQCPECRHRYRMAKAGCLQFYCNNCHCFFCSGCRKLYNKGKACGISLQCYKIGWHAHHPRNCLFFFRDIELINLQKLLKDNSFMFYDKPPKEYIMKKWCCVKVQKYSPKGWYPDACGKPVQEEYAGLCRIHYIEYLVGIVNKHLLDPLAIMTIEDMKLMLRKARKPIPEKRKEEYEHRYRTKLLKIIWQELPLEKLEGS